MNDLWYLNLIGLLALLITLFNFPGFDWSLFL
nr:MAG TPA: hypothetical protein [Caudoviricetes sp.]